MKLSDADRAALFQRIAETPAPPPPVAQIGVDIGIAPLLQAIADALASLPGQVKVPEPRDYSKEVRGIVAAINAIKGGDEVAGALARVAAAIAGIRVQPTDLGPLIEAIDRNTKSHLEVARAIRAPRKWLFDDAGEIVGSEVTRAN